MAANIKYPIYNEIRIYSDSAGASAYGSNYGSVISPNIYSDKDVYQAESGIEGKGNAYVADNWGGMNNPYYPAIPIWWMPYWGGSGYIIGWTNDSKNLGKSTPTLNKTTMDLGSTVRITFNRLNPSFKHKVWYRQTGGSWVVLADNVTANYWDWTPDLATFLPMFPTFISSVFEISVETINGTQNLGEKRVNITLTVPSTIVPTIGNISATETNLVLKNTLSFSGWVKGVSKPQASVADPAKGTGAADGLTFVWTWGNQTSSSPSPVFATSQAPSDKISVYIIDKRGRTSVVKELLMTQVDYSPPSIGVFEVIRYNPNNQDQVNFNLTASQTKLSNKNTMRYKIEQRVGSGAWTLLKTFSSYQVADFNLSASALNDLSKKSIYEVKVTVEDLLGNSSIKVFVLPASRKKWLSVYKGETVNIIADLLIHGVKIFDFIEDAGNNFLKLKGGLLIQWGYWSFQVKITSAWGSQYYASIGSRNFPLSFVGVPYLWGAVNYTSEARTSGWYNNTAVTQTNTGEIHLTRPNSGGTYDHKGYFVWLVIGQWK